MLAFLSNLHFTELILIGLVGIMIFGRNLPRLAMQIWAQLMKARRGMNKVWRETGMQDEVRRMQREMREAEYEIRDAARRAADADDVGELEVGEVEEAFEGAEHDEPYLEAGETEEGSPEEGPKEEGDADEPEGEAARRADIHQGPDPYPGNTD